MSNAARVGAFVLVSLGVLAYFILRIEAFTFGGGTPTQYWVALPEAQGLAEKSPVLYKGVRIGRVVDLDLEHEGVNAHFQLEKKVVLHQGTKAKVASVGLLGEKQLELVPGPPDAPALPPDAVIQGVLAPSLDSVMASIAGVADDVKGVTGAVNRAIGGDQGEQRISELVEKVTGLAGQIQQLIVSNRDEVHHTVQDVRALTHALAGLSIQLERVTSKKGPVGEGVENALATTENLRRATANLEAITDKIERGEGTIGKLVNEDAVADHLDQTVSSVGVDVHDMSGALTSASETRFGLGLRADYLTSRNQAKSYLHLDVLPPGPVMVRFGLVGEPAASASEPLPTTTLTTGQTVAQPSGPLTFTALAGWRLDAFTFRGGLLESRPGAGVDVRLFTDRLRLTADVWDVGRAGLWPHARLEGAFKVLPPLSLIAGWDEPLNLGHDLDSVFVGASVDIETGHGDKK